MGPCDSIKFLHTSALSQTQSHPCTPESSRKDDGGTEGLSNQPYHQTTELNLSGILESGTSRSVEVYMTRTSPAKQPGAFLQ